MVENPLIHELNWTSSQLTVLDLACGAGQNGFWFAQRNCQVDFIDRDLSRLLHSPEQFPHCRFYEWDMEQTDSPSLPIARYDLILVFHYLHRPLWPQLKAALKPGGFIIYETFNTLQAQVGRPSNPEFLLKPNELKEVFSHWRAIKYKEDAVETDHISTKSYKSRAIFQKPEVDE